MSDRHARITSLIQELAATFVQQEANTDPLITITSVNTSPDQRYVTIFFTTIPETKQEDALVFLKRSASDFRAYLKSHAKLKAIPHIEFAIDYGERHRQHIDDVMRDLHDGTTN